MTLKNNVKSDGVKSTTIKENLRISLLFTLDLGRKVANALD